METICEGAFYGCSSLTEVIFHDFFGLEDWAFSKTQIKLYT